MNKKTFALVLSVLLTAILITACGNAVNDTQTAEYSAYFVYTDSGVSAYEIKSGNEKSDKLIASTDQSVIKGTEIAETGDGFILQGTSVTITADTKGHSCLYVFTGVCSNGNIFVEKNGSDDIEIELQGLNLTEPDEGSCPLWIKGGTTCVTLKAGAGTENELTDATHKDAGGNAVKPKACINVAGNVTICGDGNLTVNGNNKSGIKSDKNITIKGGITLNVNSVGNAVSADKELCLASDYTGTVNIKSEGKGLCGVYDKDDLSSDKNWEEYDSILIQGGNLNIDSQDDAVHSNRNITVTGGKLNIKTGDDGIHADEHVVIGTEDGEYNPKIIITECFEGIEGLVVDVYSGYIEIVSSDDGINAANPENKETDSGNAGLLPQSWDSSAIPDSGAWMQGLGSSAMPEAGGDDSCSINIHGGYIRVLSGKDSFDSNGDITISGGTCVLFASSGKATLTSDGLDAGGTITFVKNGGTVFAASPSGLMQGVPAEGGQNYVMGTLDFEKNVQIIVLDNKKNYAYAAPCSDGFILYTSPTYNGGDIINKATGEKLTAH